MQLKPRHAIAITVALLGLLPAASAGAQSCTDLPLPTGAERVSCLDFKGLAADLTQERVEGNRSLVLRVYGGYGPDFVEGPRRLLYESIEGVAAGNVLVGDETETLFIADVLPGGGHELGVASFVPVNGAERELTFNHLSPDPREFMGRIFFRHDRETEDSLFLAVPFNATIRVGESLVVEYPDGNYLLYSPLDAYTFGLVRDTRREGG